MPLSEKPAHPPSTSPAVVSMEAGEFTPLLGMNGNSDGSSPAAPFATALNPISGRDAKPSRMPQAIAHRGYKAAFPENTMAAFRSAVQIGAHAIETDIHLSKDGVVVLSHDGTLKRCFGVDERVADCDWEYLSSLRTLREPREPMPRLVDLLEYLTQPSTEDIWILLDIKRDDDANELLGRVAEAISSVPAKRPWNKRTILGCWDAKHVKLCTELLPGFPLAFIGWSLAYASALMRVPNMNFNLLQQRLVGPCGKRFLKAARQKGRLVFAWTVNDEGWMEWSIRKGLDGVITDDPKLFLEVCDRWSEDPDACRRSARKPVLEGAKHVAEIVGFQILAALFALVFLFIRGTPRRHVRKVLKY
ncbi:PLC-like phosphodiesterase [Xylariales sp. AK1849]|nr:PLC-like phosphodiesterase [Xylariales sp. AK1849]